MVLPAPAAWAFLPLITPICIYVAWSDMARMRIPNLAVAGLVMIFALVGPLVLPLDVWAWQWLSLVVVLAVGFVLNVAGILGAGDAKFAAAAILYVLPEGMRAVLVLFGAMLLAGYGIHRVASMWPAVRRLAPDWVSWGHRKFPMGFPLAGTLMMHLLMAASRT